MWTRPAAAILDPVAMRCLIVDDNAEFLAAARDLLERQGVAVVGVASTATCGLVLAHELRPDVTLVDVDLGEETGFDLASRLAGASGLERMRVVLISAYGEADLAELIAASPAVGFLSKPILSRAAIEAVLARAGPTERRGT
jgi:CheY-like chemotaxis protein